MTDTTAAPLTEQQLDEIEARAQAATDGPWEASPHQHHADGCRCLSCYDDPTGWQLDHPNALDCEELVVETVNDFGRARASCDAGPLLSYQDANFAAHAREDVPALVAEIRRLRALAAEEAPGVAR